ncbi:MAG TPA: protein-L-isoaspartate(D-aspartate) O-methyltransferase [Solirubrobacteraceae bacterium]|nr:protein-L-isoaspartate(D-aspartate) O-methyltransferase [Solirubrobacteraceae bacterium]
MNLPQALRATLREAVGDERVLAAMDAVARELFVGEPEAARAYDNVALPIDCGQTISQPLVVARMLELLELAPSDRVLDVGTGSGYHAALLGRLADRVWTIERHAPLVDRARAALAAAGAANVICLHGDGSRGWPEAAPYDAINVAAAGGSVPRALTRQLADGGRLIAPVGLTEQHLVRLRRSGRLVLSERLDPVRFVPLVRGTA